MANNEHRKQKKLAKQKAKRAEKRAELARQSQPNLRQLLEQVETCPVIEALIPEGLWEKGIGQLILARQLPDGRIAFACLLLDVFCLGVKSSFFRAEYPSKYRRMVLEMNQRDPFKKVAPEKFAKIVLGSVAFAAQYGFKPDADYAECRHVLANIDPALCAEEFVFGREGKPFYINGPYESPSRAMEIGSIVKAAGGEFLFLGDERNMAGMDFVDELDDDPEALEDEKP